MAKKAATFDDEIRYLFHATKVKTDSYVVRVWETSTPPKKKLTEEDLQGLPRSEVKAAVFPRMNASTPWHRPAIRNVLRLLNHVDFRVLSWPNEGSALNIIAYAVYVDFTAGDAATLVDMGLDPEETTAEQFHDATGEWPQDAKATARVEVVSVPSEYNNIVPDVRSLQDDGWSINEVTHGDGPEYAAFIAKQMNRAAKGRFAEHSVRKALRELDKNYLDTRWNPEVAVPIPGKRELF